jgi:hypothetical protein
MIVAVDKIRGPVGVSIVVLCLMAGVVFAEPPTSAPATTYDIRTAGAVGDGTTLDTKAIQSTIDQCSAAGGGIVLVTGGKYLTGTLYLKNDVCLHVDSGAAILGSPHIADYTTDTDRTMYKGEPYMNRCLFFAKDAHNISIEGSGTIDGQGKSFPERGDRQKNRPKLIRLLDCSHIRVRDINLRSPASWTNEWRYCSDIAVDGISIISRANSNGDGIDFDGCTNIRVSNSSFDTSDDSICLQTSMVDKPCRDVSVSNCKFTSRWAGVRIGLLSRADFENVTVSDCTFTNHNDSGLKIQMNEGGEMKNMLFKNLVMKNVPRPVFLTFCQKNAWVDSSAELAPMKRVSDIEFDNITVDDAPGGMNAAFMVTGMPGHPVENITFNNIHATFAGGGTADDAKDVLAELTPEDLATRWPEYSMLHGTVPAFGIYARHVKGITLQHVSLSTTKPDARPAVVFVDVSESKAIDSPGPTTTPNAPDSK